MALPAKFLPTSSWHQRWAHGFSSLHAVLIWRWWREQKHISVYDVLHPFFYYLRISSRTVTVGIAKFLENSAPSCYPAALECKAGLSLSWGHLLPSFKEDCFKKKCTLVRLVHSEHRDPRLTLAKDLAERPSIWDLLPLSLGAKCG